MSLSTGTDPRRALEGPTSVLTPVIERTVVELLTTARVLKETFSFPATGPQTITSAADHITLVQHNFEVLSEDLLKVTPTYQNGVPNTVIGPPTSGERVLGEVWKDSLGAWWKCTAAGTPGAWQQVLPAAVATDPSSGIVPTGYLILNVSTGYVKRHAGSYSWEVKVGASASSKIGFWGATPVVQPSGADQAAVTLGNVDGEIGGLTISDPPTQAEGQALRDKCEKLADDVRALSTLVHALGGRWSRWGSSRVGRSPSRLTADLGLGRPVSHRPRP